MTTAASTTAARAIDIDLRGDLLYVGDRLVRMIRDHHRSRVILRELLHDQALPAPDAVSGMGENLGVVDCTDAARPTLIPNSKHTAWAAQGEHRPDLERAAVHYFREQP